jgi:hypothetical protein
MSESRVVITILSDKSIKEIDTLIREKNYMGKHIEIRCARPEVAALAITILGNTNKVILINGVVIKSFDSNYTVGEFTGWFADYKLITF